MLPTMTNETPHAALSQYHSTWSEGKDGMTEENRCSYRFAMYIHHMEFASPAKCHANAQATSKLRLLAKFASSMSCC